MNKFIYKLDLNYQSILSKLNIDEYCPIQDNNNNKLLINKLLLNNSKLFFETDFLKVIKVDNNKPFRIKYMFENYDIIFDTPCREYDKFTNEYIRNQNKKISFIKDKLRDLIKIEIEKELN